MKLFPCLFKSKTIWAAISIAAMSAFDSPIQVWISAHPGWSGSVVSFAMLFLRVITTKSVWEKGKPEKCEHPECPI